MKKYLKYSEEEQLKAVKQDGYAIQYLHNPSEAVQLKAVKQNGDALQYLHNPSEAVQLEAVRQDADAIQYVTAYYPSIAEITKDEEYLALGKLNTK